MKGDFMRENVTVYPGNSYPYYQDKKEKDFSLRSNPLKKHKRPHFLMWSFILQLKHPLVQQTLFRFLAH